MLLEADAQQLEVVCAAYLSQDKVLMNEIWDGIDIHSENQKRFGFPSRVIAKIFKFRLLYGGTCYSYAYDSEFNWISNDPDYWQKIINEYYSKYRQLAEWHQSIVQTVQQTGQLVMPTGRIYKFQPYFKNDMWVWPRTKILNYPVQGLGNDLLAIARVSAFSKLRHSCLFINTVHDSILVDTKEENWYNVAIELDRVFKNIPINFYRIFGREFNLPMRCEIKRGNDWKNMEKVEIKQL